MSISLCADPGKLHDRLDDIEASFWVLLYNSLHMFQSNATSRIFDMFEDCDDELTKGEPTGGSRKLFFLTAMRDFRFECRPLQDLVDALRPHFHLQIAIRTNYLLRERLQRDTGAQTLKMFDEALARSDWPASDSLPLDFYARQAAQEATCKTQLPPRDPLRSTLSSLPAISKTAEVSVIVGSSSSRKRCRALDHDDDGDAAVVGGGRRTRTKGGESKRIKSGSTPSQRRRKTPTRSSDSGGDRRVTRSQARGQRVTRSRSQRS